MLVEERNNEAKVEDVFEDDRGQGDRWTGHRVVTVTLSFFKVLEEDEVLHAGEGQEGGLPRENCPAERMKGVGHEQGRSWAPMHMCMVVNATCTETIQKHCVATRSCEVHRP